MAGLIVAAIERGVMLCRTSQSRELLEQISQEIYALISHAKQCRLLAGIM
jgi:hypothetical protein